MTRLTYILLLFFIGCSEPELTESYSECEPAFTSPENAKADPLVEFDIIPDKNYKSTGKGAVITSKVWTNGIVPFYFKDWSKNENRVTFGFHEGEERETIRTVIKEFATETGLQFIEFESVDSLKAEYKNGIVIEPGLFANSSYVGMQGGIQTLRITYSLVPHYIKHELGHALGLLHEFTRADRDDYLIVNYENIPEKYHRQFDRNPEATDCGEFDFESIMMYPSYNKALNDDKPVMTDLNGGTWGENTKLSEGDLKTIQALYKNEL